METYSLVVRWVPSLIKAVSASRSRVEKILPDAEDCSTSYSRLVHELNTILRITDESQKEGGDGLTNKGLKPRSFNDVARDW